MAGGPFDREGPGPVRGRRRGLGGHGRSACESALRKQGPKWGLDLVYALELPEVQLVVFGTTGTPMDTKSFEIVGAGADSSRDGLKCPGLAHAGAYPIEVVVAEGRGNHPGADRRHHVPHEDVLRGRRQVGVHEEHGHARLDRGRDRGPGPPGHATRARQTVPDPGGPLVSSPFGRALPESPPRGAPGGGPSVAGLPGTSPSSGAASETAESGARSAALRVCDVRAVLVPGRRRVGPRDRSGGGSSSIRYSNSSRNSWRLDPAGGRELGQLVRVLEVVAAQPDHVAARDRVARRVRCRPGGPGACRSPGRAARANGIGTKCPPCIEIIAALPPDEQVLGRAVAEVARVLHVEGDRVGAAQLVADVLGHDRGLDAELLEPRLHLRLQDLADVDLGDAHVAVGVALDVVELRQVLGGRCRGRGPRR